VSSPDAQAKLLAARALLTRELKGAAVQDVAPDPPLAALGAVDGFGAVVADSDLRLSVYVFDAWGAGAAHVDGLRTRAESDNRVARVAVNGELLFVGTLSDDGEATEDFLLNDLCSAFAGRE